MLALLRNSLFAQLLILTSCAPSLPDYVLDEQTMEDVLYDYHLAQAMSEYEGDSADYRCYAYTQKVFEKYGITEAQFDTSMVWYSVNATYMYNIYQRLNERFATASIDVSNNGDNPYASLTAFGDTANIWTGANMALLLQGSIDNRFAFAYTADTTFHQRDQFIFRADACFLMRDGGRSAVATLFITCDGDSVISTTREFVGDRTFELTVEARPGLNIRSVGGFVYFPTTTNTDGSPRRLILLNPMLVRIHRQ